MKRDMADTPMIGRDEAKALIRDLLEEAALVIGGLVAVHDVEGDLVWRLMKNLDFIRAKAMRRIAGQEPEPSGRKSAPRPNLTPHPAVAGFLLTLRRS